jgi:putative transposase
MIPPEAKAEILALIKEAESSGCRQAEVCRMFGISARTAQNWRGHGLADRRKGATKRVTNKLSDSERSLVLKTACDPRFMDLTPYAIVPTLADEGKFIASESTFYRLLRQQNLVQRKPRKHAPSEKKELKAEGPNQLWSWDITYLHTGIRGMFYYLYLILDVYSRYITGWEIHEIEDGGLSSALVRRICRERGIEPDDLTLHSDNGGPMKNATMHATLQTLGVASSFSRPSVSNDNAFSESLFKTLKYIAGYPGRFESLDEAKEWVHRFVTWYNIEHKHSRISYVTPAERYAGRDYAILEKRKMTYEAARKQHPERWSLHCRTWGREEIVWLRKPNKISKCA